MGTDVTTGLSLALIGIVFLQGLVSFFSPCVLPLVPLYAAYLAGEAGAAGAERRDAGRSDAGAADDGADADEVGAEGGRRRGRGRGHGRSRLLVNTLFFVLGVSFAFFSLGFAASAFGQALSSHQTLLMRVGGAVVIAFGLFQMGVFGTPAFMERERRLPLRLERLSMSPLVALLLGFVFSFAWTPCVGPALASVLILAGSAGSAGVGFLLIGVYTLGFALPFLLIGLLADRALDFLASHRTAMRWTTVVGGALLVLLGVAMLTGWMNAVTSRIARLTTSTPSITRVESRTDGAQGTRGGRDGRAVSASGDADAPDAASASGDGRASDGKARGDGTGVASTAGDTSASGDATARAASTRGGSSRGGVVAPGFDLVDQYGERHTLEEYRGKTVLLNFWATWCPYCVKEMPDLQDVYESLGENAGDVVILGVANPVTDAYPNAADVSQDEIAAFLEDMGVTYPVLMDESGALFGRYGVSALPATYVIAPDGTVSSRAIGAMTRDDMVARLDAAGSQDGRSAS